MALQTRIAEAEALPQFEVTLQQERNQVTRTFDDNVLVLSNHGGPIHDFDARAAYFLTVTIGFDVPKPGVSKIEVPVGGYFAASYVTAAGKGELERMVGDHNNAKVFDLSRNIRDQAQSKKWAFGLLEEQLLVELRYRDLLDRPHHDYYRVRAVGGGTRLPDAEGEGLFNKWLSAPRLELAGLTAEDLLKLVSAAHAGA